MREVRRDRRRRRRRRHQGRAGACGDCRINTFFTSLTPTELDHVVQCLSIQVEGLFGCEGVSYAGSKDSNGVACRSMVEAHTGLKISQGDFDALIEDVVSGLSAAGVAEADINAAARRCSA
ncbi:MAG: hypothetical protein U1F43_19230 [Myxococcota bacterium]